MGRRREPLGDAGELHARRVREAHPRAASREGALQREDVREGGGDETGGGRVRRAQQAAARGGGEVCGVGGAQLGEGRGGAERDLQLAPAGAADVACDVAVQVAHEEGELVYV